MRNPPQDSDTFMKKCRNTWNRFQRWQSKRRVMLITTCSFSSAVLILNVCATIYLKHRERDDDTNTLVVFTRKYIYLGSCETAKNLNTGLHVLINILSTLLLGASNLCVQLLLSPTREEIDRGHAKGHWFDIGSSSLRNFKRATLPKKVVCILLVLTSLPFTLLYNSAVFTTTIINLPSITVVTPEYLQGGPADVLASRQAYEWRRQQNIPGLRQPIDADDTFKFEHPLEDDSPCYELNRTESTTECSKPLRDFSAGLYPIELEPIACLEKLADAFGNRSNFLLVSEYDLLAQAATTKLNTTNTILFARGIYGLFVLQFSGGYNWLCGNTNTFECRPYSPWRHDPTLAKNWNMQGWRINKCYASERSLEQGCKVVVLTEIMIAICCANAVKLVCIIYTALIFHKVKPDNVPLITMGDVLGSFLERQDETTANSILLRKADVLRMHKNGSWRTRSPRTWRKYKCRWWMAASWRRQIISGVGAVAILILSAGLVINAFIRATRASGSALHALRIPFNQPDVSGLGSMNMNIWGVEGRRKGFWVMTFFVNVWQLVIAILYLILNGYLTTLCVEREWQSYATKRKHLRVSAPKGKQRGAYFVSLPARHGVPFQLCFAAMHFTLSQGLLVLLIEIRNEQGSLGQLTGQLPYTGVSPLALIITITLVLVLVVSIFGIGLKKLTMYLPKGGDCSAVLSAACHGPDTDPSSALQPVQWGVVRLKSNSGANAHLQYDYLEPTESSIHENGEQVEGERATLLRCCLTSLEVNLPTVDEAYR